MRARTVVSVLLWAVPLLGCGSTGNQSTPPVTPPPKGQPVTAAAPPRDAGGVLPKVTRSPGGINISGSRSGSVKVPGQQGGYLIKYRYKGNDLKLETNSALGVLNIIPGGQSAGSDGWTEFEDLTSFTQAGEQPYQITASQPFEIQFVKLPLPDNPDIPPKSYDGKGLKVVGPFSLKAGSASFKVSCPDLRHAGFIAELYDGTTAANKGMIALGTGASVAETKKLQVPAAGNYLIKINANGRSEWTIGVTQ